MTSLSPEGALLLDLRPLVDVRLRYAPWEEGLRVHRAMGGQWVPEFLDSCIPFVNPANDADPVLPLQRFLDTIPAEVRARAGAYVHSRSHLVADGDQRFPPPPVPGTEAINPRYRSLTLPADS